MDFDAFCSERIDREAELKEELYVSYPISMTVFPRKIASYLPTLIHCILRDSILRPREIIRKHRASADFKVLFDWNRNIPAYVVGIDDDFTNELSRIWIVTIAYLDQNGQRRR